MLFKVVPLKFETSCGLRAIAFLRGEFACCVADDNSAILFGLFCLMEGGLSASVRTNNSQITLSKLSICLNPTLFCMNLLIVRSSLANVSQSKHSLIV